MDLIHVWRDGRYMGLSFYQHQPYSGNNIGVKVTDLEFS